MMQDFNTKNFEEIGELIGDQEIDRWQNRAREYVNDPVKTEGLLSKAISKAQKSKNNQVIGNIWDKIQLLFSLVKDYLNGTYRSISQTALLAIIIGLIYFVSPIDVIPDWIAGLGLVDDAAVLGLLINQLDKELIRYQEWKKL